MDKDMQPTMSMEDGVTIWRLPNRNVHREDGPAVEYTNGSKQWRLDGKYLSFDQWLEQTPGLTDEEKVMYKLEHG
jgi:hypothetical protein